MFERQTWLGAGDPAIPQIRQLLTDYFEAVGGCVAQAVVDSELAALPGQYGPPDGAFLVVWDEEVPIGCGAIRRLEPGIAEIKRMYVAEPYRGRGISRAVIMTLMERSRELGYERVRLDTMRTFTAAIGLYRSVGFTEIPPYNHHSNETVIFFERPL